MLCSKTVQVFLRSTETAGTWMDWWSPSDQPYWQQDTRDPHELFQWVTGSMAWADATLTESIVQVVVYDVDRSERSPVYQSVVTWERHPGRSWQVVDCVDGDEVG